MTEVARRDPERWGVDDMPVLVAEARASGDQPLEAEVLRRYGFAVPTDAALDAIVACSPRGVLELGAGTGHWAALLARRGVDVVAYDVAPPPSPANAWFAGVQPWHDVHHGDERVVEECAERSLLLVWPTGTRRGRLTRSTGTTRPAAITSSSSVKVRAGARGTAASTPDSARLTAASRATTVSPTRPARAGSTRTGPERRAQRCLPGTARKPRCTCTSRPALKSEGPGDAGDGVIVEHPARRPGSGCGALPGPSLPDSATAWCLAAAWKRAPAVLLARRLDAVGLSERRSSTPDKGVGESRPESR